MIGMTEALLPVIVIIISYNKICEKQQRNRRPKQFARDKHSIRLNYITVIIIISITNNNCIDDQNNFTTTADENKCSTTNQEH